MGVPRADAKTRSSSPAYGVRARGETVRGPVRAARPERARRTSGRGRAQGEGWEDVTVTGTLPLDQDKASGTCKYGHELFVVRRGSETAAHYGIM